MNSIKKRYAGKSYFRIMHRAVVLLGTNEGDRFQMLLKARTLIGDQAGVITASSSVYSTAPWGNTRQPSFLNQVVVIDTLLTPRQLMETILSIESAMGRKRGIKWAPRIIDIDLLFYDDEVIDEQGLTVPHPLLHERRFALAPLYELMPMHVHPLLQRTIKDLYINCTDTGSVNIYNDED